MTNKISKDIYKGGFCVWYSLRVLKVKGMFGVWEWESRNDFLPNNDVCLVLNNY